MMGKWSQMDANVTLNYTIENNLYCAQVKGYYCFFFSSSKGACKFPYVCLLVGTSVCLSVCWSVRLSVGLSVGQYICLSGCLSVGQSVEAWHAQGDHQG